MSARMLVTLGLLAGAGAGCGSELPFEGAHMALVDRADRIKVEVERPLPIPKGVTAAWVRHGLAGLRLTVESAKGRATQDDDKRIVTWPLPLAIARNAGGAEAQPRLIGLPIPLVVPEVGPAPDQTAGFWIEGSRLHVAHRVGDVLAETFDVVYPVYAAQLAGTALVSGFPSEDVYRVTRLRDGMAIETLVVPGGGTLRMRLPRLPEGRFQMTFTTLGHQAPGPGRENLVPELALRLDGEEIYMAALEEDGSPVVLQVGDDPGLPTESTRTEVDFEIEVKGLPGSVVFVESPFHQRERNWRDHPNVILIVVDTLRADRLGAYGNRRGLTPNLDDLARESVRFEQCWATSSWTLPSFASMLTSTHGGQHRAWLNDSRLGRGLTTLPEAFRKKGYRTHAITDGGFVGPGFGLDRGFAVFDARGGGVEAVHERAAEFLDQAGDGPWFLMVHTYEVHAPYEPPAGTFETVMQRNPGGLLGRTPEPHRFYDFAMERKPVPAKVVKTMSDLYDEEVRYTDEVLGRLFTKLRIDGRYDDTVICLTSDHGEEFGEHGLLGHGDTLYVEQLHVPLLIRLPEAERGGTFDQSPSSLVDLAPTLLDAAGLTDLREETTFIGRSLLDPTRHRSPVYALRNSAEVEKLHMIREGKRVALRGRYLLHRPRGASANREYYDLSDDPRQTKSDFSGNNKRFAEQLARFLESYGEKVGEAQVEGSEAALGAAALAELQRLGY